MAPAPRLLLIDENIRNSDGHYLELADQLIGGAVSMGYSTTLATNKEYGKLDLSKTEYDVIPAFRSRLLRRWSLGVDGHSISKRDLFGTPIGQGRLARFWHQFRDPMSRREFRPNVMIREWSTDFIRLLDHWQPTCQDDILINTADDFVLLALANAVQKNRSLPKLRIRAVFHFAVYESDRIDQRALDFGEQVNESLSELAGHDVSLYSTTQPLSQQLGNVGITAPPIPYPTRPRSVAKRSENASLKILMAGMPRAEKGRANIPKLLNLIHHPYLTSGAFRVSMQMRHKRWQKMIPKHLHEDYIAATSQKPCADAALEIVSSNLPGDAYHEWLSTADVGLFLYDPVRYVARCSGVLLEMFVAGVPVIVPANCWLADQVLVAGGNGGVGYVYDSINEIPELLERIQQDYDNIRARAAERSRRVVARHSGENTLRQMHLPGEVREQRRAS